MGAASVESVEHFREEGRRPEWCVTGPPYTNALAFLRTPVGSPIGVAFKRRLSFFEPVVSRTQWLMQNPTATVIILTRAMYRGWRSSGVEAWLVLKIGHETASGSSIFFAQTG